MKSFIVLSVLPLLSSCVAVNAVSNIQQDIRIEAIEGQLFFNECRYLKGLPVASAMLAREGVSVDLDLRSLAPYPRSESEFGVEAWLLPSDQEWRFLRAMVASRLSKDKMAWACASDLSRLAQVDPSTMQCSFVQVPEGEFEVFVHYFLKARSGTTRPTPHVAICKLTVRSSEDGPRWIQGDFGKASREDLGRVRLESRR